MVRDRKERVTTSETTFAIIQTIRDLEEARVTDIANELGLAKSTVHRHLSTLLDEEFLVKENGRYRLSFRFLSLGEHVRNRKPVYRMAKPRVELVAEETGERAQFTVAEHGYVVYIHVALGEHAVKTDSRLGKPVPMNAVSAGKALLSELPEERVREIIDRRGLPSLTPNTITDEDELLEELERTRQRGYALNDEESTPGLRALSVPVKDADGTVLGALGVSGPTHRFKNERFREELPDLLLGVVNEFELDIQYD